MGHVRLGRLPATRKWQEVVRFLASDDFSIAELADRVVAACDKSFSCATEDPTFQKALRLLFSIPEAAKQTDLQSALARVGVEVPENPSRTDIIAGFEKAIEKAQRSESENVTDLGEIAKQAGIAAFNAVLIKAPPPPQLSFWDKPKGDTHRQLEAAATPEGVAELAQTFYAAFAKNNIRYFVDRELPKHIGANSIARSISDLTLFDQNLDRHCREASVIMRTFARDWTAKKVYVQKTPPTAKDIHGFAHIVSEKMRKEFVIRNGKDERL